MKAILRSAILFAAALLQCNPSIHAASYTTNSFSDAFVTTGPSGNLSGNNYGGAGALGVAAPGLSKGEFQTVLQFDLSGAYNSFNAQYGLDLWTIQSVTLQIATTPNNNAIFNTTAAGQFNVSLMQNNSWTEGSGNPMSPGMNGITFTTLQSTFINNSSDQALGTFSYGGGSGSADYALTLSSGLVDDLFAGSDLSLRLYADDITVSYLFSSRSGSTPPELIIDVVPEPGSARLIVMGLAAFALWRRAGFHLAKAFRPAS